MMSPKSWYCFDQSISSVQSLSRVQLFATPWIAARQASLSITNFQSSLRLTSIKSVMPSSHLMLCHPLLLLSPIPPSIRVFSSDSTLRMRWPKYWSFSFKIIWLQIDTSTSSLLIRMTFISFSCVIPLARTSSTMLNRVEKVHTFVLYLVLASSSVMLVANFLYVTFIMLMYVPSIPNLFRVFIRERYWILSNVFSAFIEMIL